MEILLLKMGEMVLKGLNRMNFERRLEQDIARKIQPYGNFTIASRQSTLFVEPQGDCDMDGALDACRHVFGLAALCRAAKCDKNMEAVTETALRYLESELLAARTFKVEARRADKAFPLNTPQLCAALGESILTRHPHLTVDVHRPQLSVWVEIRDAGAYIHAKAEPGAGGLPLGMGGKAVLLLSGGIDSPVAGYLCARRGLELWPVHFFSHPYTSPEAKDKVLKLAKLLAQYTGELTVTVVPFTAVQEAIRRYAREDLFTLLMRRSMMRISEALAGKLDCKGLITGESLGQVASQTLEALGVTGEVCKLPVLRPLIGSDKEDITQIARKIGTFETSILPYEDCCTVFTPRHPKTKPRLEDILIAEKAYDWQSLEQEAIINVERVNTACL